MGGAATAGATGAAMIFPPVLVIVGGVMMGSGIVRSMNNASVAEELQRRRTPLPITIGAREARRLDLFFPLTPLPRGLEVVYADAQGDHVVHADTSAALAAAHMPVQPEKPGPDMDALIHEESPRFPKDAVRAGIDSGVVTARLVVDAAGHPRRVELVEVSHPGVFDEEAIRVLWRYRYAMSHKPERIVDARVEFAR
jgi:hypothetical protein